MGQPSHGPDEDQKWTKRMDKGELPLNVLLLGFVGCNDGHVPSCATALL